ncbi:MAG: UMP kinase [Gammaproteobacteria bacterium]|nr:UMP kinase [Gammaproteobacteria bacterium]
MTTQPQPVFRRILLKISGAALMGQGTDAIEPAMLDRLAAEVLEVYQLGVQVAIVIGGGNFFRGETLSAAGIDRITGDHMGMLGTLINSLALRDSFERANLPIQVLSAIPMSGIVGHFNRRDAIHYLKDGQVVIFSAGTGNPLSTTDTAASLRGIEISADVVLKATNVDGVYSEDPAKNASATLYQRLTYAEALEKELAIMDLAAFCQCRDHQMPLRVFNIHKPGALLRVILGEREGTIVE